MKKIKWDSLFLFWRGLAEFLGTVSAWIVLTLFYFLIITPLGLLMRVLGKDPLKLKNKKSELTYWEEGTSMDGSSINRQF